MHDSIKNEGKELSNKDLKLMYESYFGALCSRAKTFMKTKEDAEDIVNDLFLKLLENHQNTTVSKSYLYASIHNNCIKFLEHKKVINKHIKNNDWLLDHDYNCPQTILISKEIESYIEKAINALPEQCREVTLFHIKEYSNQEIAEKLGLSVSAVGVQLNRAKSKLCKQFRTKKRKNIL